jgi:hemoglobin
MQFIDNRLFAVALLAFVAVVTPHGQPAFAEDAGATTATLYERLGSWDGIEQIVSDTIANHRKNPAISHYFADVDTANLAGHVTAFFAAGTGGPSKYEGRDMTTTHASMGLSDEDFDSAVADVLLALDQNGIGDAEKAEVASILESLRPAVMGAGG